MKEVLLQRKFLERRRQNASYSLNAFARDLGISPSLLSRVLGGTRNLSPKQIIKAKTALNLSPTETAELQRERASYRAKRKSPGTAPAVLKTRTLNIRYLKEDSFRVIAEWYHFAILNFTFVKSFHSDPGWIAEQLGIHPLEAKDAMDRLLRLGYLSRDPAGGLRKVEESLWAVTQKSPEAFRSFHLAHLEHAKKHLSDPKRFAERHFSGLTLPLDSNQLGRLREKIDSFLREIAIDSKSESYDSVYQVSVQMFPITQKGRL